MMILELTQEEAEMLMLHLREESYEVEGLSELEEGEDKINLQKESQMMLDISNRIKNSL